MTPQELNISFSHPKCSGIAVICGKVSGGLEVIDIDTKNDVSGNLYQNIIDSIPDSLLSKLKIIQTRSGGYHIYYRSQVIDGNQKFAMREATEGELKDNPNVSQVVLIESRGEGGYVVAPPSEGYKVISDTRTIATIEPDERLMLLEICRSFNEVVEPVKYVPAKRTGFNKKPWEDYNERCDVVALLTSHGWTMVHQSGERIYFKRPGKSDSKTSGDYHTGKRTFKVFTTSSQFEVGKGYSPFGIYCLLEHGNDPSKAAKALLDAGYGEKSTPIADKVKRPIKRMRDEGYSDEAIKEKLIRDYGVSPGEAEDTIKDYDAQGGDRIATFWDRDSKGKLYVSRHRLNKFLTEGGFSLFYYNQQSEIYRIVKRTGGFLEEVTGVQIKDYVKKYIHSLEPSEPFDEGATVSELMEVVLRGSDTYFSKSLLEFLDVKTFQFFKDSPTTAYFTFKNGVVAVTAEGVKMMSYSGIHSVIWKSQVLDFNVTIDPAFDSSLCEFSRFLFLVSGKDEVRYEYCLSLIGYLLHKYKHASRPWAVILAEETEDEAKGGGTGKGIFVKAIGYMLKLEKVDGKNFKLDKSFAFQRVGLDTKVVAIEDLRKNADFEGYYSVITEGVTVEKKNKDELFISYADSPKIMFTTNYTLPSTGQHAKRRQRVFEFASYFSSTYTPVDEFGHQLFDDWDEDEWNRFYNLMFICEQKYLSGGLKVVESGENLKKKHIRLSFGEEFLDYFLQIISESERWRVFGEEYKHFLAQNDYDKKDYSQKRFKKAIEDSCDTFGYELKQERNWNNSGLREFRIIVDNDESINKTIGMYKSGGSGGRNEKTGGNYSEVLDNEAGELSMFDESELEI